MTNFLRLNPIEVSIIIEACSALSLFGEVKAGSEPHGNSCVNKEYRTPKVERIHVYVQRGRFILIALDQGVR